MVDVSEKRETVRAAVARAVLKMAPATLRVIRRGNAPKQWRMSELKKLKLMAKDRMEAIIRHARSGVTA